MSAIRPAVLLILAATAAHAQTPAATPESPPTFWDRPNLTGDWGGVRTSLADHGITFGLNDINEVMGNPTGGTRQGAVYEGLTLLGLGIDTEKAFGLPGGTFNVSAFQIRGRGLSANNLDNNLHTVSSAEAERGTLLFELWYEQMLFDKKLGIRAGQLAADQEFGISTYATLFINHTFGWNTQNSTNLPSSGPSYPLATPGVRVRFVPNESLAILAAVFNGNPAGFGPGTPQQRDPSGTAFRLNDGVFAITEVQYGINQGDNAPGLPGTYKLGAWINTNNTPDQRQNLYGLSLAYPPTAGAPARGRGTNFNVYAIMDQLLYRPAGDKDGGIGIFARIGASPADRNLVSFYLDAGLTWKGIVPSRPADTAGIAVAWARISDRAAKLDSDTRYYGGDPAYPIRRGETVLELTYQAQVTGWLQVQPSVQYIFNPGGGIPNPLNPAKRLADAAVFGLRTTVNY